MIVSEEGLCFTVKMGYYGGEVDFPTFSCTPILGSKQNPLKGYGDRFPHFAVDAPLEGNCLSRRLKA